MGYRIVLRPISALLAAEHALERVYADLLAGREPPKDTRANFSHHNEIVGLDAAHAFDEASRANAPKQA
jgi:hypothetical protein